MKLIDPGAVTIDAPTKIDPKYLAYTGSGAEKTASKPNQSSNGAYDNEINHAN
jgi:hypothetical protein